MRAGRSTKKRKTKSDFNLLTFTNADRCYISKNKLTSSRKANRSFRPFLMVAAALRFAAAQPVRFCRHLLIWNKTKKMQKTICSQICKYMPSLISINVFKFSYVGVLVISMISRSSSSFSIAAFRRLSTVLSISLANLSARRRCALLPKALALK